MSAQAWAVLGIAPTADKAAIRRAYAEKLKAMDVDRDVEGYTALRAARDAALAQARTPEAVPTEGELAQTDDGVRFDGGPIGASWDVQDDVPAPAIAARTTAEPQPEDPQELSPPAVLYDLLFPKGEYSAEGFAYEEWQSALDAVNAIADDAHASAVDRQRAIEEWLAHQLATAWPRSAYLVDPAAARFHWADSAGQLTEIPAVRFLNARLRGMRFLERVSQADSPLHKAWVELSREGPKSALSRFRARRADVTALLAGIRENYPKVESHLDPVRVASWEAPGWNWGDVYPVIWVGFVVLAMLAKFGAFDARPDYSPYAPPPPAVNVVDRKLEAEAQAQIDEFIIDLFGSKDAQVQLVTLAPDLYRALTTYRSMLVSGQVNAGEQKLEILNLLRLYALRAAAVVDFQELVAIKQVQLGLIQQARAQGGAELCLRIGKGSFLDDDLKVGDKLRERERALYTTLLGKKLLSLGPVEFPKTAPIPAADVQAVMKSTGFDRAGFERAAQGEAPPA